MAEVITFTGKIVSNEIETVNDFQQITFECPKEKITGFAEVPLSLADFRSAKELTISIVPYEPEAVEQFKEKKIVFNSNLYIIQEKATETAYYFSAGGYVLRFTTPNDLKLKFSGTLFTIAFE